MTLNYTYCSPLPAMELGDLVEMQPAARRVFQQLVLPCDVGSEHPILTMPHYILILQVRLQPSYYKASRQLAGYRLCEPDWEKLQSLGMDAVRISPLRDYGCLGRGVCYPVSFLAGSASKASLIDAPRRLRENEAVLSIDQICGNTSVARQAKWILQGGNVRVADYKHSYGISHREAAQEMWELKNMGLRL